MLKQSKNPQKTLYFFFLFCYRKRALACLASNLHTYPTGWLHQVEITPTALNRLLCGLLALQWILATVTQGWQGHWGTLGAASQKTEPLAWAALHNLRGSKIAKTSSNMLGSKPLNSFLLCQSLLHIVRDIKMKEYINKLESTNPF